MATWFTADLHLGHRNIIDYCDPPFADVEAMNRALSDCHRCDSAHLANRWSWKAVTATTASARTVRWSSSGWSSAIWAA